MQPKRHKAQSIKTKSVKEKVLPKKQSLNFQFPKIFRIITEDLGFPTIIRFQRHEAQSTKAKQAGKNKAKEIIIFEKTPKIQKTPIFLTHHMWMTGVLILSSFFALFLSWQLWNTYTIWHKADEERIEVEKDLLTWENMTQRYPTYRDAYFEAAVAAYRLGQIQKEQEFLQKLQQIDPNFVLTGKLEEISKSR